MNGYGFWKSQVFIKVQAARLYLNLGQVTPPPGLNQALRPAKPPTYKKIFIVVYQMTKKDIVKSGVLK